MIIKTFDTNIMLNIKRSDFIVVMWWCVGRTGSGDEGSLLKALGLYSSPSEDFVRFSVFTMVYQIPVKGGCAQSVR